MKVILEDQAMSAAEKLGGPRFVNLAATENLHFDIMLNSS